LKKLSKLIDEIELKMDEIDSLRDPQKKIFEPRLRNEWLDSMIKSYVLLGGEIGTDLSTEEFKEMQLRYARYYFPFERMRTAFSKNKNKVAEFK